MFVFALLACFALSQASFLPNYPVAAPLVSNLPLVSNVPYPYGVVAPGLYPAGLGFNNGLGIYDRRFNAFPLGYGVRSAFSNEYSVYDHRFNVYPSFGYGGVLGYNGLLGGYNGLYYGLRK
ncbi:hypothetical protein CEXT_647231 [Caerostris extrusa]|uniref:Uncharacterized protein n=1 Tax=Caerostris extrusa TaxID=172846 RepID=A0AAV4QLH6_CAEEX|nr:hypothetical protein CEXT_647231 [Caerostris extrusa]